MSIAWETITAIREQKIDYDDRDSFLQANDG